MIEFLKNAKQRVRSWIKNALKALKVECTFDLDFHIHVTNKTA